MNRILVFRLIVGLFLLFPAFSSFGQACGCTFTVSLLPTETSWDGAAKGVKPGDKICFASGTRVGIGFYNIHGTAAQPVLITNMCDGKVTINSPLAWGNSLETQNCTYFRISGSGNTSVAQGIEIIGAQQGMNMRIFSSNFEVDHIYLHDTGSCGMVAKTDPTCDPATWRGNFIMQGVSFHDNTTVNTGCEGYYIGNSHYDGGVVKVCSGVTTTILEHDVNDIKVYNNITTSTGNEGIQVGASKNALVYNNVVTNPGCINTDPSQANGFAINGGTQVTAYNNFINGGKGYSIFDGGGGGTYYNNVMMNALQGGMLLQDLAPNFAPKGFTIFNNTQIYEKDYGIWMYSENTNPSYCYNNITVGQNQSTYTYVAFNNKPKILWNESNNLRTQDVTTVKFANPSANDFHLLTGSPAIDAGKDLTSYLITYDFDGKPRPKGAGFDMGAFEFQSGGPTSHAGVDQTITLPTNSISLPGTGTSTTGITGYTWTKKSGPAATLANASTATLAVSGMIAGSYVFTLQVTDASGSAFDDVMVTVQPATANANPTANAGVNKIVVLPTTTLTINGIGTDTDGSIASYAWSQLSGPAGATLGGNATANLALSGLVQGVYLFQLLVTDNLGATGTAQVQVTVNAATVNQLPVVDPGATRTVFLPTNSISITATASDPDGTISTIAWVKKSGSAVTLAGAGTLTVTASALTAGTYVLTITVTDNSGGQKSADITINVLNANQAPTSIAGVDRTITLPVNSVTLNGIGIDNDGSIAGYSWAEISGPAATLGATDVASLTVTNMVQGTYFFGLTVTDNQGATGYSQVKVSVSVTPPPPNESPLAFAGGNQSFSLPTNSTNLYGSGFDPDGSIASYSWVKASGGAATLTNAGTATLSLSGLAVGQYKFTLTVTDNIGATNSDVAFVTVSDLGTNVNPTADAGANKIVKLPQNMVNLTGSGSDVDGSIASYSWAEISGAAATVASSATATTLISGLAEGDYIFRLTVTDNLGATDFDDVTVHVVSDAQNLPPDVDAGPDITVSLPTSVATINGSASDDGTISSTVWSKLGGPAATLANAGSLTLNLSGLVEGIYTFQLTVTDNNSASVFDVVRVYVLPGSFVPPSVSAGADQEIALPTNSITLNGTATSSNSTISTTAWTQVSGPAATVAGAGTLTLNVTNMSVGTYIFKLTATDANALSSSANVQVLVDAVPANKPPVVVAGLNTSVTLPISTATLTGTANDPDGTVATVVWTQTTGPNTASLQNPKTLSLTANNMIAGTYTFRLTATDNLGLAGFGEVNVSVVAAATQPGPTVFAGNDTTVTVPNDQVTIVGDATDLSASIQTYVWEQVSGDPVTFSVTNQTILNVSDLKQGTYVFRLTATDDNAAQASDDVTIYVIEKNQDIPKFFSPNNDAVGQYWVFRNSDNYKQCKVTVFARSGQVVYEAKPYLNNWDGTWNGRPLSDGDYYYNIKCDAGNNITGAVRIIR